MFNLTDTQRRDRCLKIALNKAVEKNHIKALQQILKKEIWPASYPWLDYHLLVTAINLGFKEITNILLDNGARVFMAQKKNTPLHLAAARSHNWLDVIVRLVEKGARVSIKNSLGDTPLHIGFTKEAFDEKTDLLLRCHLRQSQQNLINTNGLSFLHIACSRPHLEIVQKLLGTYKEYINLRTVQSKYTPLHFAVKYGRHEIAEFLVKNGADICRQNCDGSTPLHFSLKRRDIKMADILLVNDGERRNVVNKYNLSHFMVACIGTKLDVVKDYLHKAQSKYKTSSRNLIDSKINRLSDCVGYTALHLAAELGSFEVVDFLLDRGADCCALAGGVRTPHSLARRREHDQISKMLQEHCQIVKKCMKTRATSPDFGHYGTDYEMSVLIERTREIKYLRKTFNDLGKNANVLRNTSDDIVNVNNGEFLNSLWSDF